MANYIDLHTHSYYSEGTFSPRNIVQTAKRFGISVLALTDHNTIAGVKTFMQACAEHNVTGIPAVELYCVWRNIRLHILGYYIDIKNTWLKATLEELCADRKRDIEHAIFRLKKMGFAVRAENLWKTKSHYIGFGQIVSWLERHPANVAKIKRDLKTDEPNFFDVINFYFKRKPNPLLKETALPVKKAIAIIIKAGGTAVLAHPGQQLSWQKDYIVAELKHMGLSGVEVLTPYHTWHQVEHYQKLAGKLKLKVTGGSDFHAPLRFTKKGSLTMQWQYYKVPLSLYNNLKR